MLPRSSLLPGRMRAQAGFAPALRTATVVTAAAVAPLGRTQLALARVVALATLLRQWVCSLPWRLRVLCGYDRRLCAEVLEAFVLELSRSLKRRAKKMRREWRNGRSSA